MLTVSAFYLEKEKEYSSVVSKKAKRVPSDGALLSQFSVKVLFATIAKVFTLAVVVTAIKPDNFANLERYPHSLECCNSSSV